MIKEEKWDAVMWLVERGADWDAQAQRAGETPMELVHATGNNRFYLKFKDACEAMKGKRVKDKLEASRPKPKSSRCRRRHHHHHQHRRRRHMLLLLLLRRIQQRRRTLPRRLPLLLAAIPNSRPTLWRW
jgi:hypothetical protein